MTFTPRRRPPPALQEVDLDEPAPVPLRRPHRRAHRRGQRHRRAARLRPGRPRQRPGAARPRRAPAGRGGRARSAPRTRASPSRRWSSTWPTGPRSTAAAARHPRASTRAIGLLVNNAGVALGGTLRAPDRRRSSSGCMDVNFRAPVLLTHHLLPALLAEPGSHLVNVSSLFGLIAPPGQIGVQRQQVRAARVQRGAARRAGRARRRGDHRAPRRHPHPDRGERPDRRRRARARRSSSAARAFAALLTLPAGEGRRGDPGRRRSAAGPGC